MFRKIMSITNYIIFYLSFVLIVIGLFADYHIIARIFLLLSMIFSFLGMNFHH